MDSGSIASGPRIGPHVTDAPRTERLNNDTSPRQGNARPRFIGRVKNLLHIGHETKEKAPTAAYTVQQLPTERVPRKLHKAPPQTVTPTDKEATAKKSRNPFKRFRHKDPFINAAPAATLPVRVVPPPPPLVADLEDRYAQHNRPLFQQRHAPISPLDIASQYSIADLVSDSAANTAFAERAEDRPATSLPATVDDTEIAPQRSVRSTPTQQPTTPTASTETLPKQPTAPPPLPPSAASSSAPIPSFAKIEMREIDQDLGHEMPLPAAPPRRAGLTGDEAELQKMLEEMSVTRATPKTADELEVEQLIAEMGLPTLDANASVDFTPGAEMALQTAFDRSAADHETAIAMRQREAASASGPYHAYSLAQSPRQVRAPARVAGQTQLFALRTAAALNPAPGTLELDEHDLESRPMTPANSVSSEFEIDDYAAASSASPSSSSAATLESDDELSRIQTLSSVSKDDEIDPLAELNFTPPQRFPLAPLGLKDGELRKDLGRMDFLVEHILDKAGMRYHAVNSEHHALLDTQNYLLNVQSVSAGKAIYKTSAPLPLRGTVRDAAIDVDAGLVRIPLAADKRAGVRAGNYNTGLRLPGPALFAQISGIHQTAPDQVWRLHEGTLRRQTNHGWSDSLSPHSFIRLETPGDGQTYGVDEQGLVRPALTPEQPLSFEYPVVAFTALAEGGYLALTAEGQSYRMEHLDEQGHAQTMLRLDNPEPGYRPIAIASQDRQVFIATQGGRLMTIDRSQPQPWSIAPHVPSAELRAAYGDAPRFTGLFRDEHQTLQAKVKDARGHEHACPLQGEFDFQPGWNLSGAYVHTYDNGLPSIPQDFTGAETHHLKYGSLALRDGCLYHHDKRSGNWQASGEREIRDLVRGEDGLAYLVNQQGQVKKLKISQQADSQLFDSGPSLVLPGTATRVNNVGTLPTPGLNVEKIAALNEHHYVTLSDVAGSGGTLRAHNLRGVRATLPSPPEPANAPAGQVTPITAISIGDRDLYALKGSQLFELRSEDWQTERLGSAAEVQWRPIPLDEAHRDAQVLGLRPGRFGQLIVNTNLGDLTYGKDPDEVDPEKRWNSTPAETPQHQNRDLFQMLDQREKERGIKTEHRLGTTIVKRDLHIFGKRNVQIAHKGDIKHGVRLLGDSLRAHVWPAQWVGNPLNWKGWPASIKVPAYTLQHAWRGREGLIPAYEAQTDALRNLTALVDPTRVAAPQPLEQRINDLHELAGNDPQANVLLTMCDLFQQELSTSLAQHLRVLGQSPEVGALNRSGGFDSTYKASSSVTHDLIAELSSVLQKAGLADDSPAGELLRLFNDRQVRIDNPIGSQVRDTGADFAVVKALHAMDVTFSQWQRRDIHDDRVLTKARLGHDAAALHELNELTGRLATALASEDPAARQSATTQLCRELLQLRNVQWDKNVLKVATDEGFHGNSQLEDQYDADKLMLKYMRKPNHSVSLNLRETLETNQAGIAKMIPEELLAMRDFESLRIDRFVKGGMSLSTSEGLGPMGFAGGRLAMQKSFTVSWYYKSYPDERLRFGSTLEKTREVTASVFGGGVLPIASSVTSQANAAPVGLTHNAPSKGDNDSHLVVAGRLLANLDFKGTHSEVHRGYRFMQGENATRTYLAQQFDNRLHLKSSGDPTAGGLDPLAFMLDGTAHQTRHGVRDTSDVDFSAGAEIRLNIGKTNAQPVSGFLRAAFGGMLTANLFNSMTEELDAEGQDRHGDALQMEIDSYSKSSTLKQGSASVYATVGSTFANVQAGNWVVPLGGPVGVQMGFTVDNTNEKEFEIWVIAPQRVKSQELAGIRHGLETAFPYREVPTPLPANASIDEQLMHLATHYDPQPEAHAERRYDQPLENDEQFAAIQALRSLRNRVEAFEHGRPLMDDMDLTVFHNNVGSIDEQRTLEKLTNVTKKLFGFAANPSNAKAVQTMMEKEPQLKLLIDELTSVPSTRAEVILGLKEPIRQRINDMTAAGIIDDATLKGFLNDRHNLRIAYINVFKVRTQSDAFNSPVPVINHNNSTTVRADKLMGAVTFEYGRDQEQPKGFLVAGEIAEAQQPNIGTMVEQPDLAAKSREKKAFIGWLRHPMKKNPSATQGQV